MKQQLELTIRPSRKAIARVGGALHLLVRVEPPAQPVQPNRQAVALALVIDRSGSMAGPAAASITAARSLLPMVVSAHGRCEGRVPAPATATGR